MADAFASPDDVAAIWRPLTDAERVVAFARIDQASAIVRSEVPDVDARITASTLDSGVVAGVVADMVRRVMLNPDGIRQRSRSIDDYQVSETIDSSISASSLYLSASELRLLSGVNSRSAKAFTITPSNGVRCW